MHYARWRKGDQTIEADSPRSPARPRLATEAACSVDGCDKPVKTRGWCQQHYMRWWKHGDPEVVYPDGAKRGRPRLATECSIEGCEKPGPYYRGWCKGHYWRWQKYGDPLGGWVRDVCSVEGCDRPRNARGWCRMHYTRWQEHGEAGEAEPRKADAGRGYVNSSGYRTIAGRLQHRTVMEAALGRSLEPFETVHHINGDKLDNRLGNLQLRQGKHGKGVRFECLDCKSHNVAPVPL
jgi:hypothetical protein